MTKLRIMSDLHLEFGPLDLKPIGEDILVLAGDIGISKSGLRWAERYFERTGIPAVMIAGNHEFYGHELTSTIETLREHASITDGAVTFLEQEHSHVDGVWFLGATLWTDYHLGGLDEEERDGAMLLAATALNDHRKIRLLDGSFCPGNASFMHKITVDWLWRETTRTKGAETRVILTHHLPSARSIPAKYAGDHTNPAYASDLDTLVEASGAALWIHGHTHGSCDYTIGRTRVLCNPRGYYPSGLNPDFNPNLIVEV